MGIVHNWFHCIWTVDYSFRTDNVRRMVERQIEGLLPDFEGARGRKVEKRGARVFQARKQEPRMIMTSSRKNLYNIDIVYSLLLRMSDAM